MYKYVEYLHIFQLLFPLLGQLKDYSIKIQFILELIYKLLGFFGLVKKQRTTACKKCRLCTWTAIKSSGMKKIVALIIWMDLAYMPKLREYWRGNDLYRNKMGQFH